MQLFGYNPNKVIAESINNQMMQDQQEEELAQQAALDQSLAPLQPWMAAGTQALSGLQSLATPQGQQNLLNQYTSSDLYNQQLDQAARQAARTASATGGLRGGASALQQSSLPLQLQQAYLSDQTNRLGQLAGFGTQPSSQAAGMTQGAYQFGQNMDFNRWQAQQAMMQAEKDRQGDFWGGLLGIGAALLPF